MDILNDIVIDLDVSPDNDWQIPNGNKLIILKCKFLGIQAANSSAETIDIEVMINSYTKLTTSINQFIEQCKTNSLLTLKVSGTLEYLRYQDLSNGDEKSHYRVIAKLISFSSSQKTNSGYFYYTGSIFDLEHIPDDFNEGYRFTGLLPANSYDTRSIDKKFPIICIDLSYLFAKCAKLKNGSIATFSGKIAVLSEKKIGMLCHNVIF